MLTVDEALASIIEKVTPFAANRVPLDESLGLVLAEDVISEIDSPPFDKALMDGFAIRSDDLSDGTGMLTVIEEVTAGRVPTKTVGPGEATQIMTGAQIPQGIDAVVRVENTKLETTAGALQVSISANKVTPGQNILLRGTSMKAGDRILNAGRLLRPQELGALAEMGQHEVLAFRRPEISVLATGDELVPVSETPGPGEIRNSNESMLVAQIRRAGGNPVPSGIARDNREHLREKIQQGVKADILLLSGGVSAGKLDLVPSELEAAGVEQVFHKVQVKPGKPLWFGVLKSRPNDANGRPCYVFGLPGNPVSSMVCFELFVRTAIRCLRGIEQSLPKQISARLIASHTQQGSRPVYFPSQLNWTLNGAEVTPVNWQGSSDLRGTVAANAMTHFPPGERTFEQGETVEVIAWEPDS